MKKIWFRRKAYGWGWYPASWEGWLTLIIWMFLFVSLVIKIDHELMKNLIYIFLSVGVLIWICYVKGEEPRWQWGPWSKCNKKAIIISMAVAAVVSFSLAFYWVRVLGVAHSSFENYYNFRGCTQLLAKTDTYGICQTSSGKIIKIVKYENKWFLDGDLSY